MLKILILQKIVQKSFKLHCWIGQNCLLYRVLHNIFITDQKFHTQFYRVEFFLFFGGLKCVGHSFYNVAHFMISEGCPDTNPESLPHQAERY
jgi:hypothetical protein